jgi:hypothetical protein
LEQCLVPFLKSDQDIYYSDHVFTFMVCLTGWCLEYPIIYTTHSESDGLQEEIDEWEEPKPNCLGGRPLTLIQVWLNNLRLLDEKQSQYNLLSFSYPSCLLNSDEQTKLERELKLRIDRRLVNNDRHHWIKQGQCEIRREQINLERFAL